MKKRARTYHGVRQNSSEYGRDSISGMGCHYGRNRNRSGESSEGYMASSSRKVGRRQKTIPQIDVTRIILLLTVSAVLLLTGMFFFSGLSPAGSAVVEANQQLGEVQYKVIEIESGDSLWDIAEENMNPGFDSIFDYIREIKRCNQLQSDRITSGSYLMIPYYEVEVF